MKNQLNIASLSGFFRNFMRSLMLGFAFFILSFLLISKMAFGLGGCTNGGFLIQYNRGGDYSTCNINAYGCEVTCSNLGKTVASSPTQCSVTTSYSCSSTQTSNPSCQPNNTVSGCSTTNGVTLCNQTLSTAPCSTCGKGGLISDTQTYTCTAPTCTAPFVLNTSTVACACPTGYSPDSTNTHCIYNCTSPQIVNGANNACMCPGNQIVSGTGCVCPTNMTLPTGQTSCICPSSGFYMKGSNCSATPTLAHTAISGLDSVGADSTYGQIAKNSAPLVNGYVFASGTNVVTLTVGSGSYVGTILAVPTSGKKCVTGTNPQSVISLASLGGDGTSGAGNDAINNIVLSQVNASSSPSSYTNTPTWSSSGYNIYYNLQVNMGSVAYSATSATAAINWAIYCVPTNSTTYSTPTTSSTALSITGWTSNTN